MNCLKYLLIVLTVACFGCKNQSAVRGQLKHITGLETCSWIIELDQPDKNGNKKLEPTNLNQFKISPVEGQRVKVKYKESATMSTCMAGKVVVIKKIQAEVLMKDL